MAILYLQIYNARTFHAFPARSAVEKFIKSLVGNQFTRNTEGLYLVKFYSWRRSYFS